MPLVRFKPGQVDPACLAVLILLTAYQFPVFGYVAVTPSSLRKNKFSIRDVSKELCYYHKVDRQLWSTPKGSDPSSNSSQLTKTSRFVAVSALFKSKQSGSEFSLQRLESDPNFTFGLADQRDRSFVRLLVTTAERRMGQIDKVLEKCVKTYPPKKGRQDAFVQACLRIGAAQLLFLDVPHHAAVKETIDVLRMDPRLRIPESKVKFANAVLRRLTREGSVLLDRYTCAEDNIAPWLLREWRDAWGEENTSAMALQMMKEPHVDLSIKYSSEGGARDMELLKHVHHAFGDDSTLLPHGTLRVGPSMTGVVSKWPLYDEGLWWVQDASAALPALALYNYLTVNGTDDISDMNVVDCCAAPGGKTAQLVSMGFRHVTAIESSPRRSRRLLENMDRLKMSSDGRCSVSVADAGEWQAFAREKTSGVLLDVPCSATGTGMRRPDVLRRSEDMGNLLEIQERLTNRVADHIDQNCIMIYVTCSLLPCESEDQVTKLLSREPQDGIATMETVPFLLGEIPGFDDAIDKNGWLRVLPGILPGNLQSCDGFFVARLRRTNALT